MHLPATDLLAQDLCFLAAADGTQPAQLSLAANGRFAVIVTGIEVRILQRGVNANKPEVLSRGALGAAVVGGEVWIIEGSVGSARLRRFDGTTEVEGGLELGTWSGPAAITSARLGAVGALIEGERALALHVSDGRAVATSLAPIPGERRIALGARIWIERRGGGLSVVRSGHAAVLDVPLEVLAGALVNGAPLLDGAAVVLEVRGRHRHHLLVINLRTGAVSTRMRLHGVNTVAIAERRGLAILGREDGELMAIDLLCGRSLTSWRGGDTVHAVATDVDGRGVLCVVDDHGVRRLVDQELAAVLARRPQPMAALAIVPTETLEERSDPSPDTDAAARGAAGDDPPISTDAPAPDGGALAASLDPASELEIDLMMPIKLGLPTPHRGLDSGAVPAYLDALFGLVAALCRTAIAVAWDTGRLGGDEPGRPPFATELDALLSRTGGRASALLANAREREVAAADELARWNHPGVPHVELACDLGLSPLATTILILVAAPQMWGELARTYVLVSGERSSAVVDEHLVVELLEADTNVRAAIARELEDGAPLRRWGAVEVGPGPRPFAALTAHPAVVRRLRGTAVECDDAPPMVRPLHELRAPRAALGALLAELGRVPSGQRVRIVLRGRRGSGRRTIAAALAARVGRRLRPIDLCPAAPPGSLDDHLRHDLLAAALAGEVPCVAIDDLTTDSVVRDRVRVILAAHPGPVVVRGSIEVSPPIDPGYLMLDLPSLSEIERVSVWSEVLRACSLDVNAAPTLAARYRVGPGVIARVVAEVAERTHQPETTAVPALAAALRQYRAVRLGEVATRVDTLATWDDLVLSDDLADSLRELIARVRFRRTVLESWGLNRIMTSARSVTALFQGGPGTGKTMAAGVLARELEYELWRIDLSRVMSKWLGETEKNLGAVFDAAEEGEVILLFDEADALFGKRTEVRSSHDRYANLEVNYLLQRLDAFTGLAVLTTNLGTSIDPAFKRRLSLHLQFPFPDDAERERLWRAHLPPTLPTVGDLGLADIAQRYQLSGGYIRNAALRAAYLAAAEGTPLSADHLRRAVRAEYRDKGKVGTGGPLE